MNKTSKKIQEKIEFYNLVCKETKTDKHYLRLVEKLQMDYSKGLKSCQYALDLIDRVYKQVIKLYKQDKMYAYSLFKNVA